MSSSNSDDDDDDDNGGGGDNDGGNELASMLLAFASYHIGAGERRARRRAVAQRRADGWAAAQDGGNIGNATHNILFYGCDDDTIRCINTCAATLQTTSPTGASVALTQRLASTLAELAILLDTAEAASGDDDDGVYSPFAAERLALIDQVQVARDAYTLVLHDVRNHQDNIKAFYEYAERVGRTLYAHGVPQEAKTLRDMLYENILKRFSVEIAPRDTEEDDDDDDEGLPTCYTCFAHESESSIDGHRRMFVVTRPLPAGRQVSDQCRRHRVCRRDDVKLCECTHQSLDNFRNGTTDKVIHLNCLADLFWTKYVERYRQARHRRLSEEERERGFPYVECPQCRGLLCIDRLQLVQVK